MIFLVNNFFTGTNIEKNTYKSRSTRYKKEYMLITRYFYII